MTQKPWNIGPTFIYEQRGDFHLLVLKTVGKHCCGYVGVNQGHPLWGMEYRSNDYENPIMDFGVHGGITFTGFHKKNFPANDIWWIGFDCAHSDDYCPNNPFGNESNYKTQGWTWMETEKLLKQIQAWTKENTTK